MYISYIHSSFTFHILRSEATICFGQNCRYNRVCNWVYASLNTKDRIISCTAGKYFEYSDISALYMKK